MAMEEYVWKSYGSVKEIESEPVSPSQVGESSTLVTSKLIWTPSIPLSFQTNRHRQAPSNMLHSLEMECISDPKSTSLRFVPANVNVLVALAKLWGREMLIQEKIWSEEQGHDLDLLWFLYQKGLRSHAFLKRNFKSIKYLKVPKHSQPADQPQHIVSASMNGKILGIDQLLKLGESTAHERGIQNPNPEIKIRLGFYSCAKNNPLELKPSQTRTLIRKALFDLDKAPNDVDSEILEEVFRRSAQAFQNHLTEPLEDTYKWFWGERNTFLTQIIKETKAHGPALERQAAQAALIEFAWRGILMLGECIEVLMKSFVANLPHGYEMSETDDTVYKLLYSRHPRIGGLPLIFLLPRFPFAEEAIRDLMEDPTDVRRFGVLNRLLTYYVDMTNQRRQIDRDIKKSKKTEALQEPNIVANTSLNDLDEFQAIAAEFREEEEAVCECGIKSHWRAMDLQVPEDQGDVTWEDCCTVCGFMKSVQIDRNQFLKKWKKLEEKGEE